MRSYGNTDAVFSDWSGELGQEPEAAAYVAHLAEILSECKRVLRADGTLWLNIDDKSESGTKQLLGIPWKVAEACRAAGWIVRQELIWSKAGGNCPRCHYRIEKGSSRPESVTDRFAHAHESVFLLVKQTNYYFDHEAIKDGTPANRRDVLHLARENFRGAHTAVMPVELARIAVRGGTSQHGCCAWCGAPYERQVELGAPLKEWQAASGGDAEGNYAGQAVKDYESHGAENASDLKRRVLNSMRERITVGWKRTCTCDTDSVVPCRVLDPFSGAGTTGVAAIELGRDYVGVELLAETNEQVAAPRLRGVVVRQQTTLELLPETSGVYHGRAEDLLPLVPAGSVRLVLTDPPYNVSRKNNFHTMGRTGINFEWDGDFDQAAWLQLVDRCLMPGGSIVVWNDWKLLGFVASVLDDMGYDVKRPLVWKKTNPVPRNRNRSAAPAVEFGLWAVKPGAKWVFNRRPGQPYEDFVFNYAAPRGKKGQLRHAAAKPLEMFSDIIEILSNPAELVLDPFVGGGTTAEAAALCGRRQISFEEDAKWHAASLARWKEASA